VATGTPTAAAGARTPELWSHHKVLQVPATACAERASQVLDELGFQGVTREGLSRYGNLAHNRAAVKCAEIPGGSFLYFAVAGSDRATVELLRNRINSTW
jgi:3D (Asp-Asp-Asp) domain-containing protein